MSTPKGFSCRNCVGITYFIMSRSEGLTKAIEACKEKIKNEFESCSNKEVRNLVKEKVNLLNNIEVVSEEVNENLTNSLTTIQIKITFFLTFHNIKTTVRNWKTLENG